LAEFALSFLPTHAFTDEEPATACVIAAASLNSVVLSLASHHSITFASVAGLKLEAMVLPADVLLLWPRVRDSDRQVVGPVIGEAGPRDTG